MAPAGSRPAGGAAGAICSFWSVSCRAEAAEPITGLTAADGPPGHGQAAHTQFDMKLPSNASDSAYSEDTQVVAMGCPMGYYCPAGTTAGAVACPTGTYQPSTAAATAAACLSCPAPGLVLSVGRVDDAAPPTRDGLLLRPVPDGDAGYTVTCPSIGLTAPVAACPGRSRPTTPPRVTRGAARARADIHGPREPHWQYQLQGGPAAAAPAAAALRRPRRPSVRLPRPPGIQLPGGVSGCHRD